VGKHAACPKTDVEWPTMTTASAPSGKGQEGAQMTSMMPPKTPEQIALDADLREKVRLANEAFNKLSPIDQALHRVEQRQSWVRGEMGIEHPEMGENEIHKIVHDADPSAILAAEVVRLRAIIAAAQSSADALKEILR
jgi:hypothetical protein